MIGASKILTVSYGTFSCTLEGFDDPFSTMKAIAEYFRDLAADDRYFGAEPPTPDAAMLHRIAEREVHRKVEARVDDRGVTLRAEAAETIPAAALPATTEPVAVPAAGPVVVPMVAAAIAAPALVEATEMPEGVAARLARIRAAVAEAEEAAAARYVEDEGAPAPSDLAALFAEPAEAVTVEAVVVADLPGDVVADMAEDAPTEAMAFDTFAEADHPEVAADAVELAAVTDVSDDFEAVEAVAVEIAPAVLVAEEAAFADDTFEDDLETDVAATAHQVPVFPEDELAAEVEVEDPLFFDELEDDVAEAPAAAAVAVEEVPQFDDLAEAAEDIAAPDPAEAPDVAQEAAETPEDEAPVAEALVDKAQRARARVIRIRRATQATAVATPDVNAVEASSTDTASPELAESEVSSLPDSLADPEPEVVVSETAEVETSPGTEDGTANDVLSDSIAKALAEVEETAAPADAGTAPAAEDAALASVLSSMLTDAEPDAAQAPRPAAAAPVEETAVSRLMEQTQTEMAVPENRRRLSAIAHLKAAVAATVAERLRFGRARTEVPEETRSEAYRDDLARMVRPLRPEMPEGEAGEKAPPLVLVSSQRIDRPAPQATTPAPAPVMPVRPRRIAGAAAAALLEEEDEGPVENIFSDVRGFAEFAENVGAHALPDLIEAAAAYASAIEGRDQFTRPQLMRQVETATGELVREDGLRSFGALLRDGRIVKVTRGRFAVTESSRFLAEARKLAG